MHFKTFKIARAALTALLFGASAQATILNEYNTQAAWAGVTTVGATQNFNAAGATYTTSSAGITLAAVNYLGFYNESTTIGYDTYRYTPGAAEDLGSQGIIIGGLNGRQGTGATIYNSGIRADLIAVAGIRSIGFDFSAWRNLFPSSAYVYSTSAAPIVLTLQVYESNVLADTRSLTVPAGSPLSGFYGFTTTGDISGIKLLINQPTNTESNRVALDNFAYGVIAAGAGGGGGGEIPEPQTYLLCAAGLLGLSLLGRRKR